MYLFFEKGMIGKVCYISRRHSKAKNKYSKSCNPKQEPKHIICSDANNLYGYAMPKLLRTNGFKWMVLKTVIQINTTEIIQSILKNCIMIVFLLQIRLKSKNKFLSKYQLNIADFCNISIGTVKKLAPNLFDKEMCLLYYQNLQAKIQAKIHCVLEFNQSQGIKPFVKLNTQKRKEAEKNGDKVGKLSHRLMDNAAYGKTMEELRSRTDVRLVSKEKDC